MIRLSLTTILMIALVAGCGEGSGTTDNGAACTIDPECGAEETLVVSTFEELEALQQQGCACVGNLRLTELSGVEALDGVNEIGSAEEVEIRSTTDLERIEGFEALTFSLSLVIRENESLEHVAGFSSLEKITSFEPGDVEYDHDWFAFVLRDHPKLVSVEGFTALKSAPTIEVKRNSSLTTLPDFASLEEVGDLTLIANPELEALPEFPALRRIHGILRIGGSPLLRECDVDAFLEGLEQPPRGMSLGSLSSEPCDD